MRIDDRSVDSLRKIRIEPNCVEYAEGSVLIDFGKTRVMCTATVEDSVPKWLQGGKKGWVTAEYGMLPRSTHTRIHRDKAAKSGRTQEISRLIGRSLRGCVDLSLLGERQIIVDCDVIQADGGTRTAAVTGGFVALALAIQKVMAAYGLKKNPLKYYLAAISVGLKNGKPLLDLCYDEDCKVDIDMNFVINSNNEFVELQGTAEGKAFNTQDLNAMVELAQKGCSELFKKQAEVLQDFLKLDNSR